MSEVLESLAAKIVSGSDSGDLGLGLEYAVARTPLALTMLVTRQLGCVQIDIIARTYFAPYQGIVVTQIMLLSSQSSPPRMIHLIKNLRWSFPCTFASWGDRECVTEKEMDCAGDIRTCVCHSGVGDD